MRGGRGRESAAAVDMHPAVFGGFIGICCIYQLAFLFWLESYTLTWAWCWCWCWRLSQWGFVPPTAFSRYIELIRLALSNEINKSHPPQILLCLPKNLNAYDVWYPPASPSTVGFPSEGSFYNVNWFVTASTANVVRRTIRKTHLFPILT